MTRMSTVLSGYDYIQINPNWYASTSLPPILSMVVLKGNFIFDQNKNPHCLPGLAQLAGRLVLSGWSPWVRVPQWEKNYFYHWLYMYDERIFYVKNSGSVWH